MPATLASLISQPKIDCHCHILDPARFPYHPGVAYRPAGQETGSADYFLQVMQSYGVRHALLVQPNSGYGPDNSAMLGAIARSPGRFKGIAIVPNNAPVSQLQELQAQGVVGVAFNVALLGLDFYRDIAPLLERLAQAGLFAQVQVQDDQLVALAPWLRGTAVQVLIDHCGRPNLGHGLAAPGIAALLALADTGRVTVKLSGFAKFSRQEFPFDDCAAFTARIVQTFGPAHCLWASDWPFLKAGARMDYGTLLHLFAASVPAESDRQKILWETPRRLFGF
jgi:predicted TIM-barrel fold metal-dependent hydrolase